MNARPLSLPPDKARGGGRLPKNPEAPPGEGLGFLLEVSSSESESCQQNRAESHRMKY